MNNVLKKKENQTQSQNEYLQNDLKDFISAYDLTSKESDILKETIQLKSIKDMVVPNNDIIGESTNNIPIYGTKGLLEFRITFYGKKCQD